MGDYHHDFDEDFVPLEVMPTDRLNDHMANLENKPITVLNLDSCLMPKINTTEVFKTILHKLTEKPNVTTLSLRFNILSHEHVEILLQWLETNTSIRVLYLLNCGPDVWKARDKIKAVWAKNLGSHRSDNFDQTFIRV
jgi:Ran GTPase-activating protein (RanGAP) involved in mRNA processing and transport